METTRQEQLEFSLRTGKADGVETDAGSGEVEDEETVSASKIQAAGAEVDEMNTETVFKGILEATKRGGSGEYADWQILGEVMRDNHPFSHEENGKRTRLLQAQKAECERILEEDIVPFLGGGNEALEKIKAAMVGNEDVRPEEVRFMQKKKAEHTLAHPFGEALYRFKNRDSVIVALRNIEKSFVSDLTEAQKEFRKAVSQLGKIDGERNDSIAEIVNHNLRLIVMFANKYAPYEQSPQGVSLSVLDLFQEGSIGCMRGVDLYDPEKGYELSTYVCWWIKQAIVRAINQKGFAIRVPEGISALGIKEKRAYGRLMQDLGREPTVSELAEEVGVTPDELRNLRTARTVVSLNEPSVMPRGDTRPREIADPSSNPAEEVIRKVSNEELRRVIDTLPSNYRNVILARDFSDDGDTPSFGEIGRSAGKLGIVPSIKKNKRADGAMSHEHMRKLYDKAIEALREKLAKK